MRLIITILTVWILMLYFGRYGENQWLGIASIVAIAYTIFESIRKRNEVYKDRRWKKILKLALTPLLGIPFLIVLPLSNTTTLYKISMMLFLFGLVVDFVITIKALRYPHNGINQM